MLHVNTIVYLYFVVIMCMQLLMSLFRVELIAMAMQFGLLGSNGSATYKLPVCRCYKHLVEIRCNWSLDTSRS